MPVSDLYSSHAVSGASWSPNGSEIVFTADLSGRSNIWKVSTSGVAPIQVARSGESQTNPVFSPDGKWVVFEQDHAGDEIHDLWGIPADGGEAVNLTRTPDVDEWGAHWSHDGATIGLTWKAKEAASYDLAVMDWTTRNVRRLTKEPQPACSWTVVAWSRDDKFVYANRTDFAANDSDVYRVDAATGAPENLTAHQGTARYLANSLSPDGRTLLLNSDAKGGYMNIALLDVAAKKLNWVTDIKWEASAGTFSPDGKHYTYGVNEDGLGNVYLADVVDNRSRKLDLPSGLNSVSASTTDFAQGSDRLLVSHEASNLPRDYWAYDLATRHAEQFTFSAVGSLRAIPLPASQIVHYRTFDGKTITALLWVPFNLKRDGTNPAVVMPHGGPAAQRVDDWEPESAALVANGYICIAPNPRGSTGYGAEFQRANYRDFGGGDLKDDTAAVEFLKTTGYVDATKVGVFGQSYGGFLTLMALVKTPEIWAAAVDMYGIADWYTTNSDPAMKEYNTRLLGDPDQNRQLYASLSPVTYISNVRAPLLVLQGENDPRVPMAQSQQIVGKLRKEGRVVDAHFYAGEGHGFAKRENQIDSMERTLAWFDKYLKRKRPT
jgi:dipeptidyl aminopeptidase/acylaminoacyl peptidase